MSKGTVKKGLKLLVYVGGLVALCLVGLLMITNRRPGIKSIPRWIFPAPATEEDRFTRFREIEIITPIPHTKIPQHPYMAFGSKSNMHSDASMSDTYEGIGPMGHSMEIISRSRGFGGYGTIAFDSNGRLVAVYSNARNFRLELLDNGSLDVIAHYDLPPRSLKFILEGVMPWEYIGAGMYFFLDNEDRAIVPTTDNRVLVIQVPQPNSGEGFHLIEEFNLNTHVNQLQWPREDSVAWVLPDWDGGYYWFATTAGIVGTLNIQTKDVYSIHLKGEIIENSIAIGSEGVFILSDQALYRFDQEGDGVVKQSWRTPYDPGPEQKPGVITRGSGTSVTLAGGEDGLVVVTDNAEPQINLLFVRRLDGGIICSQPLFLPGKSATDITAIGFKQTDDSGDTMERYTAIVENNWGPSTFPFSRAEPGITRVDLIRDQYGAYRCEEIWTSRETNIGVFKLSFGNGLLYTYYRGDSPYRTSWYLKAIDFHSGETVYNQMVGNGMGFNNWAGSLFLHPDSRSAYSTTIFGLVMIRDTHR